MAARITLLASLLLSTSSLVQAVARGPQTCTQRTECPVIPNNHNAYAYSSSANNVACSYYLTTSFATCYYNPANGALASGSSNRCPIGCCAPGYIFGAGATGCVKSCPAGQYPVNNVCTPCAMNTFSTEGSITCSACPGTKTSDAGSSTCHCQPGQKLSANGNTCSTCDAGTFSSTTDASTCTQCGTDKYSLAGATSCSSCPGTSSSPAGSTSSGACVQHCPAGSKIVANSCVSCQAGEFSGPDATTCSPCPADSYSTSGAANQCQSCPGSSHSPVGSTSVSACAEHCPAGQHISGYSCLDCEAGQVSGVDAAACTPCGLNEEPNAGSTACQPCLPGFSSNAGDAHCAAVVCQPGQYIDNHMCTSCAPGSFGDGTTSGSCTACLENESSDGTSACSPCDSGFSSPAGSASCNPVTCSPGQYIDNHMCTSCAPGSFGDGTTSGSCTACLENESSDGTSACSPCDSGFSSPAGSASCNPVTCSPGQYIDNHMCTSCAPGSFGDGTTSGSCTACLENESSDGTSACSPCDTGFSSPAGSASCNPVTCSPGQYIDNHMCTSCAPGSFGDGTTSGSCTACLENESSDGTSACSPCGSGFSSPAGSASCNPLTCTPGQYIDNNMCTNCAPGSYGDGTTSGSCTACLDNESSDGTSACSPCGTGFSSPAGSASCNPVTCSPGQYIDNHMCTSCAPGSFGDGTTSGSCTACLENESSDGTSACSPCGSGFSSPAGSASCNPLTCTPGQYIDKNMCTNCAPGSYGDGTTSGSCTACQENESSDGTVACSACNSGFSSPAGSASCTPLVCQPGTYIDDHTCTNCVSGTYSTVAGSGAASCQACPNTGSTSPPGSISAAACVTHCPAGKAILGTVCVTCSAGTASAADSNTCSTCPENTYSAAGAATCTPCSNGAVSKAGSSKCRGCPPGQFLLLGRTCLDCPRNTFGPGGLAYCSSCPSGTHSSSGSSVCTPNAPAPSHRAQPREQKILSCPPRQELCPVMAGSGSFECVDTQNSLESCGGCVGAPSSTGQDCSAIPDVDAVSCSKGRCLVTACHGNMTVSALGDSCVDSQTASVMRGSGFFGAFKRTK